MENDRTPPYNSNVTTAPSHSLSGRDSVGEPDENESSLTDTMGIAKKSKVETTDYSKHLSGSPQILIGVNFVSLLSDLR